MDAEDFSEQHLEVTCTDLQCDTGEPSQLLDLSEQHEESPFFVFSSAILIAAFVD
jgi:hypothetical protein